MVDTAAAAHRKVDVVNLDRRKVATQLAQISWGLAVALTQRMLSRGSTESPCTGNKGRGLESFGEKKVKPQPA